MALKLEFAPLSTPPKGVLVVFCDEGLKFGSATRQVLAETGDLVARAAAAERFKGKIAATLDIVAPTGLKVSRLVVVGVGKVRDLKARDFARLGGVAMSKVPKSAEEATIIAANVALVRKAYAAREAVANGVDFARDLVNEPANVLFPEEFADRALTLKKLGVAVEVLDVAAMQKLGMNALLGVAQGSEHEPRFVVMRWNGG